jgi:hypothetical protein
MQRLGREEDGMVERGGGGGSSRDLHVERNSLREPLNAYPCLPPIHFTQLINQSRVSPAQKNQIELFREFQERFREASGKQTLIAAKGMRHVDLDVNAACSLRLEALSDGTRHAPTRSS